MMEILAGAVIIGFIFIALRFVGRRIILGVSYYATAKRTKL